MGRLALSSYCCGGPYPERRNHRCKIGVTIWICEAEDREILLYSWSIIQVATIRRVSGLVASYSLPLVS